MDSLPEKITYGDKYGPAMDMTNQEEADGYFEILVLHSMENFGKTREEAEAVERSNLGYYAGYYDSETSERVQRLFNCSHPIFGKVDEFPTAEEAFEMGMSLGKTQKTPQV